jgi:hypothetical protein
MTGRVRKPATGERRGRLLVIAEAADRLTPGGNVKRFVTVQCECGGTANISLCDFRSGHTTTCGDKTAHKWNKHGMNGTPVHASWRSMHARCLPASPSKRYYYDRGLGVCPEWTGPDGFKQFYADMGERPTGHLLDRIDNDKGYSADNCRWVTPKLSAGNRRITVFVEHDGQRLVLAEAARRIGAAAAQISNKVRYHGITHQEAFNRVADRRVRGAST